MMQHIFEFLLALLTQKGQQCLIAEVGHGLKIKGPEQLPEAFRSVEASAYTLELNSAPALNLITFLALMVIALPVCGLRPWRSPR